MFFLVVTALSLRLKVGTLLGRWFCFTLIIVYVGGIMVIFAYLRRLVQPMKINLLRTSVMGMALLILGGPAVLRTLFFRLVGHETWTDTRFFLETCLSLLL